MRRLQPDQRRSVIIVAAVREATDKGLANVTHGSVAKRCSLQTSIHTVRHYFETQTQLWLAILEAAPQFKTQGEELGL